MMKPSISVTGIAEVQAYLDKKKEAIEKAQEAGMKQVGMYMEGKVKESIAGQSDEHASVDTGRLLGSVQSEASKDEARVYTDVPYAPFLEEGTSAIPARNHFKNTLARESDNCRKFIDENVKNATG